MQLASRTYDVEDFGAAQELYHTNGWTDGLPIVPPTVDAVEACLTWVGMTPDQLIGVEPVRAAPVTAEKLAVNAVMAGCL
ncbi:MAG TPA: UGSC family (seleno)protein, partial [Hyphomicrobiaceae bacterium]|nr:UGSC family (seleno)protein [Hyphomicrobiaceae bacterium]